MSYVFSPQTSKVCANCAYWNGERKQQEYRPPSNGFQRFLEKLAPYDPLTAEIEHYFVPATCSVDGKLHLPKTTCCMWECWK